MSHNLWRINENDKRVQELMRKIKECGTDWSIGMKEQYEILKETDNCKIAEILEDENFPINFNQERIVKDHHLS